MADLAANPNQAYTLPQLQAMRARFFGNLADAVLRAHPQVAEDHRSFKEKYLKLPGDANKDTEILGARGALAIYVSDTVKSTTESIITATQVFKDPDSSPQEQAAAVLRCFSGFSMFVGLAGPTGLVVGSIVSAMLGMVTLILDATGPARETEMQKLEGLLRGLGAEDARIEAVAAQKSMKRNLAVVRSFADESQTFNGLLQSVPITGGISEHVMLKTSEWLAVEDNRRLEKWEEVFLAYAESEIEFIFLLLTMLQKIKATGDDRKPMLAYIQEYGSQLESQMQKLMDTVDDCGDYWATTSEWHYGMHVKNPWQPERQYGGWEDLGTGSVQTITISPRNGRIWTAGWGGTRELMTGEPNQMHTFSGIQGSIDVGLVPFAEKDVDLLLVTAAGANPHTGTHLKVNEWHERRGRFLTRRELVLDSKAGFSQEWWIPAIPGPGVLMARMFRDAYGSRDLVYLVRKEAHPGGPEFSLWFAPLDELKRGHMAAVNPTRLRLPRLYEGAYYPFRISASKRYLYAFSRRAAWRVRHDTLLREGQKQGPEVPEFWEPITFPAGTMSSPDSGLWHENELEWGSNGINDLYAWSDDHVLATLNSVGHLWCGHFDAGDPSKWKKFYVEYTSVDSPAKIAQGGRSLIVVAWVGDRLHFRIFDANGQIVVDTDERRLAHRPELDAFKLQLKGIPAGPWPRDLDSTQKSDIIAAVTDLLGSSWRWKQIYGGAARTFKQKPASFDYARWLQQAGANLRAGRTELVRARGA